MFNQNELITVSEMEKAISKVSSLTTNAKLPSLSQFGATIHRT